MKHDMTCTKCGKHVGIIYLTNREGKDQRLCQDCYYEKKEKKYAS